MTVEEAEAILGPELTERARQRARAVPPMTPAKADEVARILLAIPRSTDVEPRTRVA